ncbi:hypothetical protein BDV96DRAFT_575879 [Lophiotrema nucula]|uniref:WHIM1 domain-containing protein n=1 Tax=Lophiotrema nucula TaxID=690887 RepID=A0A6A5Z8R6_9PLEO|nr:hypothetical protein BDV96DRAFT_575879 [Lophiotrema nucula]
MSDSESSLSSPPSTEDEMETVEVAPLPKTTPQKKKKSKKANGTILAFFDPPSPPRKKRPASPPHDMVPEDNPDIAFIVMFRSRFYDAFPPKTPHFGPQDIELGVANPLPSAQVEHLLCALLGLVLNRKKPVEKGHYGRALEEAIQTQKSQWPRAWGHINPISQGRSFNTMTPSERITLLKTLALWSLNTSTAVNDTVKKTYQARTTKEKNDTNIELAVQPWGRDGDKRRYWLIEGRDDTSFRVYRESNPALKTVTWWSVAGSIDEIRVLGKKLEEEDGTREAKALSEKMLNAIPRFEATELKRKRREYKRNRDEAFRNPEFSYREGRTRGKRTKYTYSDEEDFASDATDVRRSTRRSGRDTPAVPGGPTVTASGRQVRTRATGLYGESLLSGQTTERASPATGEYVRSDASEEPHPAHGRSTRAAAQSSTGWQGGGRKHIETYNDLDEMDDEDEASESGNEWDGGDEDEVEDQMDLGDDEDDLDDDSSDDDGEPKTLVVRLRYPKGSIASSFDTQPAVKNEPAPPVAPPVVEKHAAPLGPLLAEAPQEPKRAPPVQPTQPQHPAPVQQQQPFQPAPVPVAAHAPIVAPVFAPSQLPPPIVPNGFAIQPEQQPLHPPVVQAPLVQALPSQSDLYAPPKPPFFMPAQATPKQEPVYHAHAPTPPYAAQDEAAPKAQYPNIMNEDNRPPFVPTTLPNPTPASSWQ